jgi:hypothetical protein
MVRRLASQPVMIRLAKKPNRGSSSCRLNQSGSIWGRTPPCRTGNPFPGSNPQEVAQSSPVFQLDEAASEFFSPKSAGERNDENTFNGVAENLRRDEVYHDGGDQQGQARAHDHHAPGDHNSIQRPDTLSQTVLVATDSFLQFGGGPYTLQQPVILLQSSLALLRTG